MINQEDKITKRRLTTSVVTTIISISIVLYMLGILCFVIIGGNNLSNYFKENIGFSVYMQSDAPKSEILALKRTLDAAYYTKSTKYITKEQATIELKKELGEDFLDLSGYNPLPPTIEVSINAAFSNQNNLKIIETEILKNPYVREITYQRPLVDAVNNNIKKISYTLLIICGVLLLIAIILIHNTLRLNVYAKRFVIKSMLLVGANSRFIRRPFIYKGVIQGFLASLIAIILLVFTLWAGNYYFPDIINIREFELYLLVFGAVITIGFIISWISTFFAVRKFIKMKTDNLYY